MMNLPLDAEPLGDGHFVWADSSNTSFGVQFFVYTLENGYWQKSNVCDLRYPAHLYWRTPRPDELKCRLSTYGQSTASPAMVETWGRVIRMSAILMEVLNEGADEKIKEAEARFAQDKVEREQRDAQPMRPRDLRRGNADAAPPIVNGIYDSYASMRAESISSNSSSGS